MNKIKLAFVILNYNTANDVFCCVDSIRKYIDLKEKEYKIIVVDNKSTDNSVNEIKSKLENIDLVESKENLGFAKGNNLGIKFATKYNPDFTIALNSDVELIEDNLYSKIKAEHDNSKFGVLGPKIKNAIGDINNSPWQPMDLATAQKLLKTCQHENRLIEKKLLLPYRVKNVIKKKISGHNNTGHILLDVNKRHENVEVQGSFVIFSKEAIEKIGGFDDATFLYYEEQLLFQNIKKAGLKSVYTPKICILHKEGGSTKITNEKFADRLYRYNKYYINSLNILIERMGGKKPIIEDSKFGRAMTKIKKAIALKSDDRLYSKWIKNNEPTEDELEKQKQTKFKYQPKISIVVPLYNTREDFFRELVDCLRGQTYNNWELCLADGSPKELTWINAIVASDERIKYKYLKKNGGISINTNEAIKLATGDYIGFCDHDDLLTPSTLFEYVKAINQTGADFVYCDEDKIVGPNKKHTGHHFKPDFCPENLYSYNYITHFTVVSKQLLAKVGPLNKKYDGAQDYEFILRATDKAKKIHHIPKVLYHWRVHEESTAKNISAKNYAIDAGRKAISDFLNSKDIKTTVTIEQANGPFCYHPHLKSKVGFEVFHHRPSKDEIKTDYIIIVDQSIDNLTQKDYEEMIGYADQKGVGCVGTLIRTATGNIWHAGVIVSNHGAHNLNQGQIKGSYGYLAREYAIHNQTAVSGRCLAISSKLYKKYLDNNYQTEYWDIDLCLSLVESGYRNIYLPTVCAVINKKPKNRENAISDSKYFYQKWHKKLSNYDNLYNPNFKQTNGNYELNTNF